MSVTTTEKRFVVTQEAVYLHGVFGPWLTLDEAIAFADAQLAHPLDDWHHDYVVREMCGDLGLSDALYRAKEGKAWHDVRSRKQQIRQPYKDSGEPWEDRYAQRDAVGRAEYRRGRASRDAFPGDTAE